MNEILNWLSAYSTPVVILILTGAVFIYIIKMVTEKTISNEFDKYKKDAELKMEKRSNFEEKILLDRYLIIRELQSKIGNVLTNLNRIRHGGKIEGFLVNNDIVPLTEVFEMLALNKYLITDTFYHIFHQQSLLALDFAGEKDESKLKVLGEKYLHLQDKFYQEMNNMFGLDKIKWEV
ncbi:MAG TPA: hypothetical protein VJY62_05275 [Bacteroidia bacterium]|nr:hypothetical protein [Bacteroidia bacterium]